MATIIASQAVISGAFSVTQQAIQLGFIPRLRISHTSEHAAGQIYIPVVNWALMIMVILLVLTFRSSSNLAAAYGIAVTGAMAIDTVLISVVFFSLWKWPAWKAFPLLVIFSTIDILYFSANLLKVPAGGWFPLLVGAIAFTFLTTWAKGRKLMIDRMAEASLPIEVFIKSGRDQRRPRARHGRVHDHVDDWRPARAAAQSQAQQGAARTGECCSPSGSRMFQLCQRTPDRDQRLWRGLLSGSSCAMASWRKSTSRPHWRQVKELRPSVQDDGHQLLPRPPDADRVRSPGHGDLAREAVRLDAAQRRKRDGVLQASRPIGW
jgi:hypothetical protein